MLVYHFYWLQFCSFPLPSTRQHPSYGDWRLRGNIIRTAPCWVVWHDVHSRQHTYMSSSYSSSRLGLSHWDPYAMHIGGCLELYYCNMVEWSWWDYLICKTNWLPSVLWHCWFGHMTCKIVPDMTYNVFGGTLNLAQSICLNVYVTFVFCVLMSVCAISSLSLWWINVYICISQN